MWSHLPRHVYDLVARACHHLPLVPHPRRHRPHQPCSRAAMAGVVRGPVPADGRETRRHPSQSRVHRRARGGGAGATGRSRGSRGGAQGQAVRGGEARGCHASSQQGAGNDAHVIPHPQPHQRPQKPQRPQRPKTTMRLSEHSSTD